MNLKIEVADIGVGGKVPAVIAPQRLEVVGMSLRGSGHTFHPMGSTTPVAFRMRPEPCQ